MSHDLNFNNNPLYDESIGSFRINDLSKSSQFAKMHKSTKVCESVKQLPCWEIKEGGECPSGIYHYLDTITFCGSNSYSNLNFLTTSFDDDLVVAACC